MAWDDRLREAAYTSPGGTRIRFIYEDVSKRIRKKTTGFNFADVDGTYVQDLGREGRRFPLRVIFSGADYDLEANTFEDLLSERGAGKLEHPLYGVFDVVPYGTIARRDDLKTAANQAIFTVTFWETTGTIYPTTQEDLETSVISAVEDYNEATAEQFNADVDLDTTVEKVTFENIYSEFISSSENVLQTIADTQEDVKRQYDAINDSIKNSLDTLIGDPLTLAFQTVLLLQAPARSAATIQARLDAYGGLIDLIINQPVFTTGLDSTPLNSFLNSNLYATGYLSAEIVSAVNNVFETKTDAINAAETILDTFADITAWADANHVSLGYIDTGGSYQKLQEAVALAAGYLVEISFSLKQERRIVLTRARTFVDLCAELYGELDPQYDFFIESNELTGSEIIEIPKGREIVYYI